MINSARSGTLLIDEAYQLTPRDATRDFGIETIMATIEGGPSTDDDRPAYIFAGYTADMERFMSANMGLKRRITDIFNFTNYSRKEIFEIFREMSKKGGFTVQVEEDDALNSMMTFSEEVCELHNAGIARALLAACRSNINRRVLSMAKTGETTDLKKELMCITENDFSLACETARSKVIA